METTLYTAFLGDRLLKRGPLTEVLAATKLALSSGDHPTILIFDEHAGRWVDFNFGGSLDEVLDRYRAKEMPRGRGRPRLGVESREVTLFPRHWAWLQTQPNGASAALRRLVEEASRTPNPAAEIRRTTEATYQFMLALAGDRPGFEEASRALFAGNEAKLREIVEQWPSDISEHILRMNSSRSPQS